MHPAKADITRLNKLLAKLLHVVALSLALFSGCISTNDKSRF